jgi:Tfp pilus tip-associated adhesin PilY1
MNRFYVLKDHDRYDSGTLYTIDGREYPAGDLTDVGAYEDRCPAIQPDGYFYSVADGEKFTTNAAVFNSFFFVSTYTPDTSDVCRPAGASKLYGALARCGQGFFGDESTYSPGAGVNRNVNLGVGLVSDPRVSISPGGGGNRIIISKQDGEIINEDVGASAAEHGMLYWRELD